MGRAVVNKFNRGEISTLALARDDVDKVTNTCELMDNFMPLRLGPMRYRPGLEYIGATDNPTASQARALIPLTRSTGDSIMLEFAGSIMRPLVDGLPLAVSADTTALLNEEFTTNITSWNGSGLVAWLTGGYANFTGETGQI